jgi:hypothetical protein
MMEVLLHLEITRMSLESLLFQVFLLYVSCFPIFILIDFTVKFNFKFQVQNITINTIDDGVYWEGTIMNLTIVFSQATFILLHSTSQTLFIRDIDAGIFLSFVFFFFLSSFTFALSILC